MRRQLISIASAALLCICVAAGGYGCGSAAGNAGGSQVQATWDPVMTTVSSPPTGATPTPLQQYADRLVDPATINEPVLARLVAGLLARGLPVIGAEVVSQSPLAVAITVPGDEEGQDVYFASPQVEREAVAEWATWRRLTEVQLKVEKPNGDAQTVWSMPPATAFNLTPDKVAPPALDLAASRRLLADKLPAVVTAPLGLLSFELNDDVMNARLLHVRLLVPDFDKQAEAFERAEGAVNDLADNLTKQAGLGVGVVWIDAVNAEGGIRVRNWADRQLNSGSGQNVLAKDYLPSNWSRPATTAPASTSTTVRQTTSTTAGPTTSVALDSGITGMVTLGPISPVQREGEPNDKPYSATIMIRDRAGAIVTQVQSGADGRFTVNLPPGTYTLEPVNGNPLPRAGTQDVTIQPHTFAEVTISYDTGIR